MQEREPKREPTELPYHSGEFSPIATSLESHAAFVEQLRWPSQSEGTRTSLALAAQGMRYGAAALRRAQALLEIGNSPAPPLEPATERVTVSDAAATTNDRERDAAKKQPRLDLTGRLGVAPRFRRTTRGKLVAELRIGVPAEDGATRWETVLLQEDRARKLQDQGLTRGQVVHVIGGYLHERSYQTKRGETKHVREIWATDVRGKAPTDTETPPRRNPQ